VRDVAPPGVKDPSWVASPIDAFVLAKLEARGLAPSARADRRTLIRRATFDLTGLPPTAGEIAAFEADPAPEADAFARLVERLLASPRYGERWGRHWLDVARYADTKGYVFQEERRYPYSYTYRDYVIRAFNDDLPYDQFLVQQIAADLLPQGADTRALAAMGFLTVGRRFLNNRDDIIDDRIDVVSRGLLGLTVACARCHDHKFDPIPTADYYSLYGVFASSVEPKELPTIAPGGTDAAYEDYRRQLLARQRELDAFVAEKRGEIQAELRGRIDLYLLAAFDLDFEPRHPKFDERCRAGGAPARAAPPVDGALEGPAGGALRAARPGARPLAGLRGAARRRVPRGGGRAGEAAGGLVPCGPPDPGPVLRRGAAEGHARGRAAVCRAPGPGRDALAGAVEGRRPIEGPPRRLARRGPGRTRLGGAAAGAVRRRRPDRHQGRRDRAGDRPRRAGSPAGIGQEGRGAQRDARRRPAAGDGPGRRTAALRPPGLRARQPRAARRGRAPTVPEGPLGPGPYAVPRRQRPPGAGPGDRPLGQPADGPRPGQPDLDAPLRRGPGPHAQRLRPPQRPADAPRAARLPRDPGSSGAAGRSRRCTG
jgi:hypothetical protein